MPGSEIAQFKQQQVMHEQAAQRGLQAYATVAPHKIITARLEQAVPHLVQLLKDGKVEECDQAVNEITTELREEGDSSECHTMTIKGNSDA